MGVTLRGARHRVLPAEPSRDGPAAGTSPASGEDPRGERSAPWGDVRHGDALGSGAGLRVRESDRRAAVAGLCAAVDLRRPAARGPDVHLGAVGADDQQPGGGGRDRPAVPPDGDHRPVGRGAAGRPGGDRRRHLRRQGAGDAASYLRHRPDGPRDRPGQAGGAAGPDPGPDGLRAARPGPRQLPGRDRPRGGNRGRAGHGGGGSLVLHPVDDGLALGPQAAPGPAAGLHCWWASGWGLSRR